MELKTKNRNKRPRSALWLSANNEAEERGNFWSRNRLSVIVLFVGTALLFYACYLMAKPFVPALSWALALAIVANPAHRWIARRIGKPGVAAALSVGLVVVVIVAPMAFVLRAIANKAVESLQMLQSVDVQKSLESALRTHPQFGQWWRWNQADPGAILSNVSGAINSVLQRVVGSSVWGTLTFLIAFLMLFYFWRDRALFTGYIRHFLPLSESETTRVFDRLKDTIHASIYGTLVVAAVQGALGGLMFWWLGLPAPLLWGVAMGLLAVVPVLGAFVIWIPVAIFLAIEDHWAKAVVLTVWGTFVIGLIDNLLYPILVGKRLRLHTVPVFIGILGGLMVFGASGLVLGPVLVALTDAVLNIWRCRTTQGRAADSPEGSAT